MRYRGDTLEIDGFSPVELAYPIDWSLDPYHHPTWRLRLHSLEWLCPYVDRCDDIGARETVESILAQWIAANPLDNPPSDFSWSDHSTALRASVLVRVAQKFQTAWLVEAMRLHASVLASDKHYVKRGNHALDQCIALHELALFLGDEENMSLAESRIGDLAADSIDEQGVTNEGAVSYQSYNFRRYGAAIAQLERSGRPISPVLKRRERMMDMLAYATRPDLHYEQIGDTPLGRAGMARGTIAEYAATEGRSGPKPSRRVAIFDAGYIFGRSGWGEARPFAEENFYSIRYGSGDASHFHGHVDHTSVTWHPRGIPVLIDGGFHGYERADYRYKYVRAPEGHNVVVARNMECEATAGSRLVTSWVGEGAESFHIISDSYPQCQRSRRILVIHDPAVLVVFDELASVEQSVVYDQLWHFHPAFDVKVDGDVAIASNGVNDVMLAQVLGGEMRVVRGETDPIQGWVSFAIGEKTPTPTIVGSKSDPSARFLTVLALGTDLETRLDGSVLEVRVGGRTIRTTLDADDHHHKLVPGDEDCEP